MNTYQVNVLNKCLKDVEFFLDNYYLVANAENQTPKNIKFRPFQKEAINDYKTKSNIRIASDRQNGSTETAIGLTLYYMLFNMNKNICIVSHNMDAAKNFRRRLLDSFNNLNEWMRPNILTNNNKSLELDNGNKILFRTHKSDLRGLNINLLVIDNTSFLPKDFIDNNVIYTMLDKNDKIIMVD